MLLSEECLMYCHPAFIFLQGNSRKLRSRRNLVDTSELISDATFEMSVPILNNDSNGREG